MKNERFQKSARVGLPTRAYKAGGPGRLILRRLYARTASLVALCLGAARTSSMPRLAVACNDDFGTLVSANDGVLSGDFAVVQQDGLFVPYGEYPNEVTGPDGRVSIGVQVVDREAGLAMANEMASFMGRARSLFLGRPIFVGHPYHPQKDQRASYPDKASRGWIKSIEVQEEGIKFVTSYNELGSTEVNDARFGYHSPEWRLAPVPGRRNAFRPVMLRSTGLTNFPNIPVPPIIAANEDPATPVLSIDLNKIVAALKEAGLIKDGDDETAILNAIGGAARELQWARERRDNEVKEAALLRATIGAAIAGNDMTPSPEEMPHGELISFICGAYEQSLKEHRLQGERLTAANEQLLTQNGEQAAELVSANESLEQLRTANRELRTARAALALEPLIKAGKVTGAGREAALQQLCDAANEAAFAESLQGLSKAAATLPTAAPTQLSGLHGKQKIILASNEQSARSRERSDLVNACMAEITKGGAAKEGDHDRAWTMASRRKPELFK
ncbi:MAG: hypothetical protein ACO1TE_29170 [Prosthecobacter sp.]